jgi:TolB-like protein/Flp pilus assembly protein TadD
MTRKSYRFESFVLDLERLRLLAPSGSVDLRRKSFEVLRCLVEQAGRVVTKEELIRAVWPDVTVSDESLAQCVSEVRRALGDDSQRIIKTVPRRGYLFDVPIGVSDGTAIATPIAGKTSLEAVSSVLPLPERPSIAVLPFEAMGGDAELESFTDGLTADIITGLSQIKAFWVIARHTTFTYKGRAIDVRTVGRDLGVRYVLEGSVRKSDGQLRLTAQLAEAETGHHIWATKIDRTSAGLFELQDGFTQSVVAPVQTQLILSEGLAVARKGQPPSRVGDLLARGRQRHYDLTPEGLSDLVSLAEKALDLDPGNGEACRLFATGVWLQAYHGFIRWDRAAADQVMSFAQRAVVAEPADEYSHWILAMAHLMACQHHRAVVSLRRALDINPSCSLAYGSTGTVLAFAGQSDESIANNELVLRINPGDPTIHHRYFGLALAHYLASRYATALQYAELAVQLRPDWWLALIVHSTSLAQVGRAPEARAACVELRRAKPDMTVASLNGLPFAKASDRDHVADGLRKAGLPEN